MLLTGGAMTGTGRTIAQGGITIEGNGIGLDDGRVLVNQGDTEWLSGVINLNPFDDGNPAAGTFVNDVGATFNQRFNGGRILATNFGDADNGTSALFNNLGSYYKGATGVPVNPTTVIAAAFNNAGELRVNDNVVQLGRSAMLVISRLPPARAYRLRLTWRCNRPRSSTSKWDQAATAS
jgi:hypothetical protein